MKTIMISKYIAVQGRFVEALKDGSITVRVGTRLFRGFPV
ncbi:hypothetical protein POI8812_00313 [Pontivivens insulae]|uniref:Translation initiation factor IF-2 n=1 Tax=Pontivivens insulae TaxID=1639689 RepID=A0A2R8A743_9RHOB|nr:hypothetical protein DFR53_0312 [Pontivivens insulae]SPF28016.1 hypothetical protein POI8812_00313 [Pontivivens insulae]